MDSSMEGVNKMVTSLYELKKSRKKSKKNHPTPDKDKSLVLPESMSWKPLDFTNILSNESGSESNEETDVQLLSGRSKGQADESIFGKSDAEVCHPSGQQSCSTPKKKKKKKKKLDEEDMLTDVSEGKVVGSCKFIKLERSQSPEPSEAIETSDLHEAKTDVNDELLDLRIAEIIEAAKTDTSSMKLPKKEHKKVPQSPASSFSTESPCLVIDEKVSNSCATTNTDTLHGDKSVERRAKRTKKHRKRTSSHISSVPGDTEMATETNEQTISSPKPVVEPVSSVEVLPSGIVLSSNPDELLDLRIAEIIEAAKNDASSMKSPKKEHKKVISTDHEESSHSLESASLKKSKKAVKRRLQEDSSSLVGEDKSPKFHSPKKSRLSSQAMDEIPLSCTKMLHVAPQSPAASFSTESPCLAIDEKTSNSYAATNDDILILHGDKCSDTSVERQAKRTKVHRKRAISHISSVPDDTEMATETNEQTVSSPRPVEPVSSIELLPSGKVDFSSQDNEGSTTQGEDEIKESKERKKKKKKKKKREEHSEDGDHTMTEEQLGSQESVSDDKHRKHKKKKKHKRQEEQNLYLSPSIDKPKKRHKHKKKKSRKHQEESESAAINADDHLPQNVGVKEECKDVVDILVGIDPESYYKEIEDKRNSEESISDNSFKRPSRNGCVVDHNESIETLENNSTGENNVPIDTRIENDQEDLRVQDNMVIVHTDSDRNVGSASSEEDTGIVEGRTENDRDVACEDLKNATEVASVNMENDTEVESVNMENDTEVASVNMENDTEVESVNMENDTEVASVNMENDTEMASVNIEIDTEVASVQRENDTKIASGNFENDKDIDPSQVLESDKEIESARTRGGKNRSISHTREDKHDNQAFTDTKTLESHQTIQHDTELTETSGVHNKKAPKAGKGKVPKKILTARLQTSTRGTSQEKTCGREEKPYQCIHCRKHFVSPGMLKAHCKTHTGHKEFRCNVCSASLTTNGSLKRHMVMHSSSSPFWCNICEATFSTAVRCRRHMKMHQVVVDTDQATDTGKKVEKANNTRPRTRTQVGNVQEHSHDQSNNGWTDTEQRHLIHNFVEAIQDCPFEHRDSVKLLFGLRSPSPSTTKKDIFQYLEDTDFKTIIRRSLKQSLPEICRHVKENVWLQEQLEKEILSEIVGDHEQTTDPKAKLAETMVAPKIHKYSVCPVKVTGPWRERELPRLKSAIVCELRTAHSVSAVRWGVVAQKLPSRTPLQCFNQGRELLSTGWDLQADLQKDKETSKTTPPVLCLSKKCAKKSPSAGKGKGQNSKVKKRRATSKTASKRLSSGQTRSRQQRRKKTGKSKGRK